MPTGLASIFSASASITAPTLPSRRPTSSSLQSQGEQTASGSARRYGPRLGCPSACSGAFDAGRRIEWSGQGQSGRGSFTKSFPLFGYQLSQYDKLFTEKLDLFVKLLRDKAVTWRGETRPPLTDQHVFPPIDRGTLKTWIGVGGSPKSVIRAARYGLPLMLAIIGGDPKRFKSYAELYLASLTEFGQPVLPIGIHSPGYIAETDEQAREELWPDYKRMRDQIGAERGWPPMRRDEFDHEAQHGSLYVGAPETVARRIAATAKALGAARFDLKYSAGMLSHEKLMTCITLYGSKVIPLVREMLA